MNNTELAKSKIERAWMLYQNFDDFSETDMKNIFYYLMNALELVRTDSPNKYELYGHVRSLASMDIKKFGGIFKAMNWKDSVILKKEDVKEMIIQTRNLVY